MYNTVILIILTCMSLVGNTVSTVAQSYGITILNANGATIATGAIRGNEELELTKIPIGKFIVILTNLTTNKQCRVDHTCLEIPNEVNTTAGNGTGTESGLQKAKSSASSANNARREMQPCTFTGIIDWSGRAPVFTLTDTATLPKGTEYFSVKVKGGNGCTIVRKVTVF